MRRWTFLGGSGAVAVTLALSGAALAQETVKIGLILPTTGPFASTGRQIEADVTKRLVQALIVNDKIRA